ncbi:hypothetical protein SCHPADRAFT_945797 [Schizopora paradoxa]|uniref:Uncharacterized protein n=1 Tax=Schizopora paradoxa TaxID=27342 RepID=A0A0H2R4S6_9AGAM|nr:hypothetical protein SCHPADRAFT_945797 [Schizopora paradoxa]
MSGWLLSSNFLQRSVNSPSETYKSRPFSPSSLITTSPSTTTYTEPSVPCHHHSSSSAEGTIDDMIRLRRFDRAPSTNRLNANMRIAVTVSSRRVKAAMVDAKWDDSSPCIPGLSSLRGGRLCHSPLRYLNLHASWHSHSRVSEPWQSR